MDESAVVRLLDIAILQGNSLLANWCLSRSNLRPQRLWRADGSDPDHLIQMLARLMEAAPTVADGLRLFCCSSVSYFFSGSHSLFFVFFLRRYQYLLSQNRLPAFCEALLNLWPRGLPEFGENFEEVSKFADALQQHS